MGCAGSTPLDLDTFLSPQKKDERCEIISGVVGNVGHTQLKCGNIFDLGYGADIAADGKRADAMNLQWDGANVATIEVTKGQGSGKGSYPKCWTCTTHVKDKSGQVVAQVTRELTKEEWQPKARNLEPVPAVIVGPATVFCTKPAYDGQAAAPNGMFAWALMKTKQTQTHLSMVEDQKEYANFGLFPLSADHPNGSEPSMLIVRVGGPYAHVLNGDRSQNVGVADHTKITAAQGVDPLLVALLMLEFKMRVMSGAGVPWIPWSPMMMR